MSKTYISTRNLKFILFEVLQATSLQRYQEFADYDADAFDMSMDASKQLADTYLFPYYQEMDKNKAYYADGEVHVHQCIKTAMQALGKAGWIAAPDSYDMGGQQMPYTLLNAALLNFYAANGNIASYAFLTQGAARLIRSFGTETLQQTYIPHMYEGRWQGTMALTEPQAGSSLSDVISSADPLGDGVYAIKGQKIFISGGDHNAVDNVVHLMLARIKGAPAGTKGISLFVVPKLRLENGQLVSNDVTTAGIFGKMGQKGYVAAHLIMGEKDNCRGYLVGEPHKGLSYMFQMMNEARIGTGLMAIGTASAAYYASLQYALERPQGRHPSNKDATQPQVLIIEHADVRRMLLFQKAIIEGSISLLLQCSYYSDIARAGEGQEQENAHLLLELLTPIAKSYPSDMGTLAVSTGMQVLGGAGYCDDFPLEQYYRDIRVNSIYEGTTTIHGMDLLGRKVQMAQGKAAALFAAEVQQTILEARAVKPLANDAEQLEKCASDLQKTTTRLLQLAQTETPEVFLADATLYLEFFSLVTIGWQWLKQALVAARALDADPANSELSFYKGKINTCRYYFAYELPKTQALYDKLNNENSVTLEITPDELM